MNTKNFALMDLHLHLDGSLSTASARELAAMQGISLPESDSRLLKLMQVSPNCRDLNEYLEKFDFPLSLLQSEKAISRSVSNLCGELAAQGLIYCEIRFAPQLHCRKGLNQSRVIRAAIEGAEKSPIPCGLILCCMRGSDNAAENLETVKLAREYLGKVVCAVDLAGAEALFPTGDFRELFELAKALGLPYTIHAGEAAGPDSIRQALSMGAARLGHGVRCCEDSALMKELAEAGTLLELCPSSNLHTCIFPSLSHYPIRTFLENGVKFSINTDNMAVSATSLLREWELIEKEFSLSEKQRREIAINTAAASFADPDTKSRLIEQIANM